MTDNVLALTFPAGAIRDVAISATAGNAVTNITASTGKRARLLYGTITLVADATVVNREMSGRITDGTNDLVEAYDAESVTAGQTRTARILPAPNPYNADSGQFQGSDVGAIMFPKDTIIQGADQIRISVTGGVAGDSYSGRVRLLEL